MNRSGGPLSLSLSLPTPYFWLPETKVGISFLISHCIEDPCLTKGVAMRPESSPLSIVPKLFCFYWSHNFGKVDSFRQSFIIQREIQQLIPRSSYYSTPTSGFLSLLILARTCWETLLVTFFWRAKA